MKYGKHQPRHFRKNTAGRCKTKQYPQFYKVFEQVAATKKQSVARNFDFNPDEIREIIGKTLDNSSTDFTAFNTNFGKYMPWDWAAYKVHDRLETILNKLKKSLRKPKLSIVLSRFG